RSARSVKVGCQMKPAHQTTEQLTRELTALRQRVAELEAGEAECRSPDRELHRVSQESIFQAIGHATLILSPDQTVLAANRAAVQATGLTEAELRGQKCYDIFHRTDHPPAECPLNQMQYTAYMVAGEMEVGALDGWFLVSCTPVLDESGELEKIIHIATDITERKQAEDQLRQRNRELEALNCLVQRVSASLLVEQVVAVALEEIVAATQSDLALLFLREGDRLFLLGTRPPDTPYRHPDTPVHLVGECLCGLAVSGGEPLYSNDIYVDPRCTWDECKKAGVRSFAALPLRSGDAVIGVLGLAAHQTSHFEGRTAFLETLAGGVVVGLQSAQLYQAVQRHWKELSTLYETSQALSQSLDPGLIGQRLIEVMEQFLNYEHGAVLTVDEETQELVPLALSDQQRGPDFVAQDRDYVRSQGLRVGEGIVGWVVQHGQPVRLGDVRQDARYFALREDIRSELCVPLSVGHKVIGALDVESGRMDAYDENDERLLTALAGSAAVAIENARLYAQLREHAATLEQRVAERTAELADINTELDAFAYSVSHDLRAPLRAMQGFAKALLEDYAADLDPTGQDYAQRIVTASQRLDTLIQDLLAYSRLTRAELSLQPTSLDLVVIESLAQLTAAIREQDAQVSIDGPLPLVLAQHTTLVRVVVNLLANAIKFAAPGVQPQVRVWAEVREGMVRLWVQDNGVGIAPAHQERIFRIFERLYGMEEYPGTGVGLAIVRKGVERMGGRVGVTSAPGQGSRFWVELPGA
ncbi:MAG: GAF domain-containing protein, partial [Chloroflexi bacterium]|nr:GAF domain-containing protein [Chloroflexota bacterium]